MFSNTDIMIIRRLQEDMPLVPEPYQLIAEELGISENELLNKIQEFYDKKVMRRFGATLNHRKIGFHSNAMVVWKVPDEKIKEASSLMVSLPQVSHCYQRVILPDWPYNIYTMIHGQTEAECERITEEISNTVDIQDYCILYSTAELKKCSMKYFSD